MEFLPSIYIITEFLKYFNSFQILSIYTPFYKFSDILFLLTLTLFGCVKDSEEYHKNIENK